MQQNLAMLPQVGLKLLGSGKPPALVSQVAAGTIGMHHHAQLFIGLLTLIVYLQQGAQMVPQVSCEFCGEAT